MEDKLDIKLIIGNETYIHRRMTIEDMQQIDWGEEVECAILQAQYDNKD